MPLPKLGIKRKRKQTFKSNDVEDDADGFSRRGVIYIGRIPHGFYEDAMYGFFSQFGKVTKVKVARNQETLKPQGYGYVQFKYEAIAKVAADTMDNYIMYNKALRCKLIAEEEVPRFFHHDHVKLPPRHIAAVKEHNKPKSEGKERKIQRRLVRGYVAKKKKLAEMGIDYELQDYEDAIKEMSASPFPSVKAAENKVIKEETQSRPKSTVKRKTLKKGELRRRVVFTTRKIAAVKKQRFLATRPSKYKLSKTKSTPKLRNRAKIRRKSK